MLSNLELTAPASDTIVIARCACSPSSCCRSARSWRCGTLGVVLRGESPALDRQAVGAGAGAVLPVAPVGRRRLQHDGLRRQLLSRCRAAPPTGGAAVACPNPESRLNAARRITLELRNEPLRLAAPFRISGYVFEHVPVTRGDAARRRAIVGRGEAAGVYYLGDEPERHARHARGAARRDRGRPRPRRPCSPCCRPAAHATRSTARCGNSRRSAPGMPVWKLAGHRRAAAAAHHLHPRRRRRPTVMAARRAGATTHARALKLKLTGELELDIERVRAVRAARPDVWIGVDANQGYRAADARHACCPALVDARVSLLEQPCRARPRGRPRRHRPRRSRSPPTKAS